MPIQNPEIIIAQKAKKAIYEIKPNKEFVNYLKGLPSNIVQNGLIQTLAFIKGKDESKYKQLYKTLHQFFVEYFKNPEIVLPDNDMLNYLTDNLNDLTTYILYQKGILTFCIWLKQFGNAFYNVQSQPSTEN